MDKKSKKVIKIYVLVCIGLTLLSGFISHSLRREIPAMYDQDEYHVIFSSYQIKPGDNLYKIADLYYKESVTNDYYTKRELVKIIATLNNLKNEDKITSLNYLVLPRLTDEKEEVF